MGELLVTIDDSDHARVRLCGDGRGADFGSFEKAAVAILAASPSRLVVDLDGLSAADTALVTALNGIARRAEVTGSGIAVEIPVGALDWLSEAALDQAVRF